MRPVVINHFLGHNFGGVDHLFGGFFITGFPQEDMVVMLTFAMRAAGLAFQVFTQHDRVLSLTVHDGRTATAKVRLALPASAASPAAPATPAALHTELLVLLRDDVCGWRIISKLQAASDLSEPAAGPAAVGAADFGAAAAAAGGYLEAARACSAPRLSALVHELGRLTYASAEGRVQVLTLTLTLPLRPTLTLTPNPCP